LFLGELLTESIPNPHSDVELGVSATILKARHSLFCKFSDKSNENDSTQTPIHLASNKNVSTDNENVPI
ncbi:MAG: hypothetical protein KME15_24915, partial [Drouetiella hepatica Uher 2000/2452]|nr:hypothetical protein [Drouetiella hepatica Uher 2000/2452]